MPKITVYLLLLCVDPNSELIKAVTKRITEDKGFKLPTPQASAALTNATKLLQWMNDNNNKESLENFSKKLVGCLQSCFPDCSSTSLKMRREKMWKIFHLLRACITFMCVTLASRIN